MSKKPGKKPGTAHWEAVVRERDERIAELERQLGKRESSAKRRVYEAAREEARLFGFDYLMSEVIANSGVSQGAIYNTHYKGGKEQITAELCAEIHSEANAASLDILEIEDGRAAMMAWMRYHAEHVHRWGMLSAQILSGRLPKEAEGSGVDVPGLKRFFGHLVRRCKEQGHCRQDLTTRSIVHTWAVLLHPDRVTACLDDGLSLENICELTMDFMVRAFYLTGAAVMMRALDPPTGLEVTRYEGIIDDDYYLEYHKNLFSEENFTMARGMADLRNVREVRITPKAIHQMCEWSKLIPDKFPPPAKLAIIANKGPALDLAHKYYEIMNEGPVNVEVFDSIEVAREWLTEEFD